MKQERTTRKWSELRKSLAKWEPSDLIDLVKELYDASPTNRDFLHARLVTDADDESVLKPYRERIATQFYPKRGDAKLKLAEARKAIREYHKATGNVAGTIELMLTFVEHGTAFTRDYGDINEAFYSSLESVLSELVTHLCQDGGELYPRFRDRLEQLAANATRIGWGYGDFVLDQVGLLEDELSDR